MWLTASVASVSVRELSHLWLWFVSVLTFIVCVCVCVCSLYSFGKQLGGRRGCECITLEPSEMIVVSRDAASLPVLHSLSVSPKHLPFSSSHTSPCLWYYSCFSIFIWCLYHLFSPLYSSLVHPFTPFLSSLSFFLSVSHISVLPLCVLPPLSLCMHCISNSNELHWQDVLPLIKLSYVLCSNVQAWTI